MKENTKMNNENEMVDTAFADFKNSLLIVSVLINVFVFTMWLTLQMTDQYNAAVIQAFLGQ